MNKQWRCFFCGEVFRSRDKAALHFGAFDACEADEPACKLMQHQERFMEYVRGLEEEIRQYQNDNTPLQRAIWDVQALMQEKVNAAEEAGYARGVRDMMKQGQCPKPEKHNV